MVNTDKILPLRDEIEKTILFLHVPTFIIRFFSQQKKIENIISRHKNGKKFSFLCHTGHDPDAFSVDFFHRFSVH